MGLCLQLFYVFAEVRPKSAVRVLVNVIIPHTSPQYESLKEFFDPNLSMFLVCHASGLLDLGREELEDKWDIPLLHPEIRVRQRAVCLERHVRAHIHVITQILEESSPHVVVRLFHILSGGQDDFAFLYRNASAVNLIQIKPATFPP